MRRLTGALALALAFMLSVPTVAAAEPLSEVALYHRCYVRMTGLFPDYQQDPGLNQVRQGQASGVEACLAVLDQAMLMAQGTVEQPAPEPLAEDVLSRFHRLHSSWFLNPRFQEFDDISLGTESLYDPTEPAAYITRALLNPTVPASSILTAQDHLRVLRRPSQGTLYELGSQDFAFDDPPLLRLGPMAGVEVAGPLARDYRLPDDEEIEEEGDDLPRRGTFEIGAHYGGGVLGSSSYLLLNVSEALDFSANGGRKMPRKWAKAILHDVLCRDLPAIRVEDAIPFVVADSAVPFRRQTNCTQCHASIDRIASTIRGFRYALLVGEGIANGGYFATFAAATRPQDSGWPAIEDPDYGLRPAHGTLYFRDHAGELVDLPLRDPADLGRQLAQLDGPYICLAQRYYRYFTGIEAYIGDPQNFPLPLTAPTPATETR